MLEIKNVSKAFGDKEVLKQCSFVCNDQSVIGIVGVNGAGKSTLLRCICSIYQCDEGEILLDGKILYENENEKKNVMFLSDDPYISSSMTIKDLKDFYCNFYTTFHIEDYKHYLSLFHFDENIRLKKLSKGMRRQAFILVILSFRPKILVLDESFDGLDLVVRQTIKKAISHLVSEYHSTVILSSHNIHDLESICDHVIYIENGKVSSCEDIDENKELYHRYQLVFNQKIGKEDFKSLEVINVEIRAKFVTIIVKGEKANILNELNALKPIMIEELELSLEELFVAKMKGEQYGL